MPTKTETKETVVVTVSAKLVAQIKAQIDAQVTLESKKLATSKIIKSEAERLGYDEKQMRQMVVLSWREARGIKASASEKEIADFDLRSRPDISKVIALAYPVKEASLIEAIDQNEAIRAGKGPKGAKIIGENNLLEIARGNLTVAKFNKGIKPTRTKKNGSKLSPSDQLGNRFVSLYKEFVTAELVTEKEANRLFAEYFKAPEVAKKDEKEMAKS